MFNPLSTQVAAMFLVVFVAASVAGGAQAAPEPEFEVITKDEAFELRDYPELVIAKTTAEETENSAFRRLFNYISGENSGAREISMTAPVLMSDEGVEIAMTAPVLGATSWNGEGGEVMAFILPAEFTPDTAPLPTNPEVTLGVVPARRVAVATFSGWAGDDDFAEAETALTAWMSEKGLTPAGAAETAQYDPPWTLGPFRRNEVLIPVAAE